MRLSYLAQNPAGRRHVFFLSALSLAAGVVTALLPADSTGMRLVFAGTGLVLFLLLASYTLRFTAVSFRYEIQDGSFRIIRVIRNREKPVLSVPLKDIRAMYPVSEAPPGPRKNACPTLRGKKTAGTVILYEQDDRTKAVTIECPYSFARALSREAAAAQADSSAAPPAEDP